MTPWDSTDKYRDEDASERRIKPRRRWNRIFGRRSTDLNKGEPRTYRTKSGKVLTDAEIWALSEEAERGYDIEKIKKKDENET